MSERPNENATAPVTGAFKRLMGRFALSNRAVTAQAAPEDTEEDFEIPWPTYATIDSPIFYQDSPYPPTAPTQADREDAELVVEAMQADPAWDQPPPPMYRSDAAARRN